MLDYYSIPNLFRRTKHWKTYEGLTEIEAKVIYHAVCKPCGKEQYLKADPWREDYYKIRTTSRTDWRLFLWEHRNC